MPGITQWGGLGLLVLWPLEVMVEATRRGCAAMEVLLARERPENGGDCRGCQDLRKELDVLRDALAAQQRDTLARLRSDPVAFAEYMLRHEGQDAPTVQPATGGIKGARLDTIIVDDVVQGVLEDTSLRFEVKRRLDALPVDDPQPEPEYELVHGGELRQAEPEPPPWPECANCQAPIDPDGEAYERQGQPGVYCSTACRDACRKCRGKKVLPTDGHGFTPCDLCDGEGIQPEDRACAWCGATIPADQGGKVCASCLARHTRA